MHKPDAKHGDAGDGHEQQCSPLTFTQAEDSLATTAVGDEEDAMEQGGSVECNISHGIRGRSPHIDAVAENTPHVSHSSSYSDHPPIPDDVNHDESMIKPPCYLPPPKHPEPKAEPEQERELESEPQQV